MNTIQQVLSQSGASAKFAGVLAQFFATPVGDTGWKWGDAVSEALASGQPVHLADLPLGRFLAMPVDGVVGFTWGQAVEEAVAHGQEVDLGAMPMNQYLAGVVAAEACATRTGVVATGADDFERRTGWRWSDAFAMAVECRSQRRGRRLH
ncbi:MAG: hypothetical protein SFV17_14140 [Candidatus Obscuribacter sp.]|nr:hypothetical protein [Candidatus Obscuribacter sp.]